MSPTSKISRMLDAFASDDLQPNAQQDRPEVIDPFDPVDQDAHPPPIEQDSFDDEEGPPHLGPPHLSPLKTLQTDSATSEVDEPSSRKSSRARRKSTRIISPIQPPTLTKEGSIDRSLVPSSLTTVRGRRMKHLKKAIMAKKVESPKETPRKKGKPGPKPKKKTIVKEEHDVSAEHQRKQLEFTHSVPERQPNGKKSCFMCNGGTCPPTATRRQSGANEKEESDTPKQSNKAPEGYVTCGIAGCGQLMHLSCLKNFVCSEYRPRDAALLFSVNNPVCPGHFCWHCYDERNKNASRFDMMKGDLVDCTDCIRSFHTECVPAGATIKKNHGKRSTTRCFMHVPVGEVPILDAHRLKHCTECEQLLDGRHKAERMKCDGCTNVFHLKCSFKKVEGKMGKGYKNNFCAYCIQSTVIVPNQYVLAYYPNCFRLLPRGNYPGKALANEDVPEHIRKLLGTKYGKFGWIPVMWIWDEAKANPFYNMVHKSRVQRMFLGSDKNLPDDLFLPELARASQNFSAPTRPLDIHAMFASIKIIKGTVYSDGVQRILEKGEYVTCSCKPAKGSNIKCETAACENRLTNVECTKHCDDKDNNIFCANRSMQNKEERNMVKYEVKVAEGKGFGVFATVPIKANEFIFEYGGEVIDEKEHQKREARVTALRSHDEFTYMMGLAKKHFVDARFIGNNARFVNHSCEPNCEVNTVDIPVHILNTHEATFEPKIKVTALKGIAVGEEITFGYQLSKSKGLAIDNCKCGAESCKGKIGEKKNKNDTDDEFFDRNKPLTVEEDDRMERIIGSEEKENSPKKRKSISKKTLKKEKSLEKSAVKIKKRRGSYSAGTPKRGRPSKQEA